MSAPDEEPAGDASSPSHDLPSFPQPLRLLVAVGLFLVLPGIFANLAHLLGFAAGRDGGVAQDGRVTQVCIGLTALVFVAFALRWPPPLPWRPASALATVRIYAPFAVVWVAFTAGYLRVAHACGHPVPPQPELAELARNGLTPALLPIALGAAVVAPVVEELLFRGYLLGSLLLALPRPLAHVATAAAFGAVHGPDYALPIGVLGLFFGWLRHRRGSLLPSMIAHGLHNSLVIGVTVLWPGSVDLLYPR